MPVSHYLGLYRIIPIWKNSETSSVDYVLEDMDDFLTPVSTVKVKRTEAAEPLLQEVRSIVEQQSTIDTPERALETLKQRPDYESVTNVLSYLANESERKRGFHLMLPDPIAANIVYQLINTTIPDYWQTLKGRKAQLEQLIRCLCNPCGIGNTVTRLRPLIADCRQKKSPENDRDSASHIIDLIQFLEKVFQGDRFLTRVWTDIATHGKDVSQRKMIWKEFVVQVASGRVISLVAEAEDVLKERVSSRKTSWLADGSVYSTWLGRNIANLTNEIKNDEENVLAVVDMFSKALSLGYTGESSTWPLPILTLTIRKVTSYAQYFCL